MKNTIQILFFLILNFTLFSCIKNSTEIKINKVDSTEKIKNKVIDFVSALDSSEIKPTFSTSLDSVSVLNPNLKISSSNKNNGFVISINENRVDVKKLLTINDVWSSKDSVNYANNISEVKYYKPLNLLLLQLNNDMCTGLGCSVNYQLIYDLYSKKVFPFGRFRTGFDMKLYKIKNNVYYLSKTFHGRNAEQKDTIFYNLYKIEPKSLPQKDGKHFARFTYENEDYDKETSFIQEWIK